MVERVNSNDFGTNRKAIFRRRPDRGSSAGIPDIDFGFVISSMKRFAYFTVEQNALAYLVTNSAGIRTKTHKTAFNEIILKS